MPIQIETLSAANRAIAAQMLRDYSLEPEPEDYHEREDAYAAHIELWLGKLYDEATAGVRYHWLAYAEGQPVGFVSFRLQQGWFDGSTYGKLDEFYIVPAARRQGAGRELAQMAFAEMQRQGANSVELGVIMSNPEGLAFWQNLGLQLSYQVLMMPLLKMPLKDLKE